MAVDSGESETYTVRVPDELASRIDAVWEERGYVSRSEFIRDALRTAVDPPVRISDEFAEHLETSREQRERGEYVELDDVG